MDIKMKITPEVVKEHGLSEEEYQIILDRLGREPNINELGIFSVMWSELSGRSNGCWRHHARCLYDGRTSYCIDECATLW